MKITPFVIALLFAPWAAAHAGDAGPSRPNVVFIIADDQGYTDYGFMGHEQIQTPHLDRLARESLTFTRGYVPTSLCCPSLASIITGRYPHQHGVTSNDPPTASGARGERRSSPEMVARWNAALDDAATLPRLLAAEGYLSFQTGKWWHGDFTRGGFTHGMTQGTRHGDAGLKIGREGMKPIYDFIGEARRQEKPFFVWYAPFMPHTPHTPPERLFNKYRTKTASPHIARYWAMCEWADETYGELLGFLDREGLSDNTLVIYLCDNGWIQSPNNSNFAAKNKSTPYDFGLRTPILVRWPGKVQPRRAEELVSSIDLAPTVLAALKIAPPTGLPGVNLLDAKATAARKHVFGACFTHDSQSLDDPAASLLWRWTTDGRWKLIAPRTYQASGPLRAIPADRFTAERDLRGTLEGAEPLLFDLQADPREEKNLASTQPEVVAALLQQLNAWWVPEIQPTVETP